MWADRLQSCFLDMSKYRITHTHIEDSPNQQVIKAQMVICQSPLLCPAALRRCPGLSEPYWSEPEEEQGWLICFHFGEGHCCHWARLVHPKRFSDRNAKHVSKLTDSCMWKKSQTHRVKHTPAPHTHDTISLLLKTVGYEVCLWAFPFLDASPKEWMEKNMN